MKLVTLIVSLALGVLPSTPSRVEYTAAGGTTFPFAFKVFSTSHVKVYTNGALQNTGYTVSLNANQDSSPGGTVTFLAAPTTGATVRIDRTLPLEQSSVWTSFSKAKSLEFDLDKSGMRDQQIVRDLADHIASVDAAAAAVNGATPVLSAGGTTPRTLNSHFGDVGNVKDFGAVGDGVTNDTAAFQAAVNARDNVFVPDGDYVISTVQLRETTTISGAPGRSRLLVVASASGLAYTGSPVTNGSTVTVRDLAFVLGNGSTGVYFHPAVINNSPTVKGCTFTSSVTGSQAALGIDIWGTAGGLVEGNTFYAGGYSSTFDGLRVRGDSTFNAINVNITSNYFKNMRKGISLVGSSSAVNVTAGHRVVNNLAIGMAGYALEASFIDYLPVQANMFDFSGGGVAGEGYLAALNFDHVHRLILDGNWIASRYAATGVNVVASDATGQSEVRSTQITGNRIINMNYGGTKGDGIRITSSNTALHRGVVSNNRISNVNNGIVIQGTAAADTAFFNVMGNDVEAAAKAFLVNGYSIRHTIIGNTFDVVTATDAISGANLADGHEIGANWINASPTRKRGKLITNGDGATKTWTIAHGLSLTPQWASATAGGNAGASDKGIYVQYDATNIYINFVTAPTTGTNNVVINWEVSAFW